MSPLLGDRSPEWGLEYCWRSDMATCNVRHMPSPLDRGIDFIYNFVLIGSEVAFKIFRLNWPIPEVPSCGLNLIDHNYPYPLAPRIQPVLCRDCAIMATTFVGNPNDSTCNWDRRAVCAHDLVAGCTTRAVIINSQAWLSGTTVTGSRVTGISYGEHRPYGNSTYTTAKPSDDLRISDTEAVLLTFLY